MRYRIFAALELTPELRQRLAEVQDNLSQAVPGDDVRWSRLDGVHLTVKFYGDVQSERLADIEAGLARAAAQARPIRLGGGRPGGVPHPHRAPGDLAGPGGGPAWVGGPPTGLG